MSIKYDLYTVKNPNTGNDENFAKAVSGQTIGTKQLAKEIERATTLTTADIKAALNALSTAVKDHLMEGDSVHIEGLGYFKPSLKCTRKMTSEKASGKFIEVKTVRFRPERDMIKELKRCTIVRSSSNSHSASLSDEEVDAIVKRHFENNTYLRRSQLQSLAHLTKETTCKHLRRMTESGWLRREGPRNAPIYIKTE